MKPITFYHPAVQCACMFLGEFLCIIPYLCQQWKHWSENKHPVLPEVPAPNQGPQLAYMHSSSATEPLLRSRLPQGLGMSLPLVSTGQFAPSRGNGFTEPESLNRTGEDSTTSVFVLALPTLLDATSSLLMNVAIFYTSASTFQMLRGLVVFWAGVTPLILTACGLLAHNFTRFFACKRLRMDSFP